MSEAAPAPDLKRLRDALLAIALLRLAAPVFGGVCLRGSGPARDLLIERLRERWSPERPWLRLPGHVDDERLMGGLDVAASLAGGRQVARSGLLAEAAGGLLVVPMAERLPDRVAGRLAQAMDASEGSDGLTILLLDDGIGPDEHPAPALLERVAFQCDLSRVHWCETLAPEASGAIPLAEVEPLADDALAALAAAAGALGIGSARALLFAQRTARTRAALNGRRSVEQADLDAAARLVLAPRATRLPPEAPPPGPEPEGEASQREGQGGEQEGGDGPLPDTVLAAAHAAIPAGLLERIADGRAAGRTQGGGAGRRTGSKLRGRPLAARPGLPRGGARLALIDTLRAAIPWQPLRKAGLDRDDPRKLLFRKDDLRVRRFEERAISVTVLAVDASGSAAIARLAETKGAVELILAQAYVTRSEVALIAFRGEGAELLLPPTRSLARARRALAELPGGGGTPLAAGIALCGRIAEQAAARGRTPFLVLLTDGSANIAADGTPGRSRAGEDALAAARRVALAGTDALLIDISPRPRPEAARLAEAMRARCLPLPHADARALEQAVAGARRQAVGR